MKRIALIAVILSALIVAGAGAQVGKIELYADATMSGCELVDQGTTLMVVHAFYTGPLSTGVRFIAPKPSCWLGATWVGDTSTYTAIGNSQTDWSIAFAACLSAPVHVGQSNYFATGGAEPCCEVVAMASLFGFVYTDCWFGEYPLSNGGQKVVINPNESCRCQSPLAIETTTWGGVKSLYR